MRTIIRGGWIVGFNGSTHTLIRNGVLVYDGNRIVHVGGRYDGPFDAEIDAVGKLVAPASSTFMCTRATVPDIA